MSDVPDHRRCRLMAALAAAALLAACEAPLDMTGVAAREAQPLRRSDLLQQAALTPQALVVVGNHGLLLRSVDGAQTWSRQVLDGWPALIDVTACPDGRFAALAAEGQVLVSGDDGRTWTPRVIPTEESPQAITCDPANRLWVVGSFSTIIVSSDGGASWQSRSGEDDVIFTTIQFIDERTAVVFGEFGSNLRSRDGGETWEAGEPLADDFYTQDALFLDAGRGWVAGLAGVIRHTSDGGLSWRTQPSATLAPVYALASAGEALYAAGGEGALLREESGEWRRIEHGGPARSFLRVLQPLGGGRLLIGGASGTLSVVEGS